jgi:K+-transporting ATPase c subunit
MKNLITAILMTVVTTVLLGLIYPLVVTGLAQVIFPEQANGQLIRHSDGTISVRELSVSHLWDRAISIRGLAQQARWATTLALLRVRTLAQRVKNLKIA